MSAVPPKLRVRKALFVACALMLGTIVALALVEIVLRVFHLAPSAGITTVTEAEFARVPGLYGPGQHIVDRQLSALPFAVRINNLGFRGPDLRLRKPPGELRILAIGDSFTFGDFVDDEVTLPAQLQGQVSRRCGRPVTVMNAGVGGTTIDTHLEMAKRGWVTGPDLILLTFSENDATDLKDHAWDQLAANRKAKSRFPLSVVYPVLRRMAVWHFALRTRARLHARAAPRVPVSASSPDARSGVEGLRTEYGRLFHELVEQVRSRGGRLVLTAFPSHWTVRGVGTDEQLSWLEGLATSAGIPAIDLLGPLRANGQSVEMLYLLPHDGHASTRGNEVAAHAVARRLVELGFCAVK